MITDMITLRSKYLQIRDMVIILIAILMVNKLAREQCMILPHNVAGDPCPLSMDDKRLAITMLQPGEVASLTAKNMFPLPDLAPEFRESLAAAGTRYHQPSSFLAGIHTGPPQDLKHTLPGNPVLGSKGDHRHKPCGVRLHYVNQFYIRQMALRSHGILLRFDGYNIHHDGIVVKVNSNHKYSYKTYFFSALYCSHGGRGAGPGLVTTMDILP